MQEVTYVCDQTPDATRQHSDEATTHTFSRSAREDEDWTEIADLAERQRIQSRIARRNYRQKLKRRLEDLERRAGSSDDSLIEERTQAFAATMHTEGTRSTNSDAGPSWKIGNGKRRVSSEIMSQFTIEDLEPLDESTIPTIYPTGVESPISLQSRPGSPVDSPTYDAGCEGTPLNSEDELEGEERKTYFSDYSTRLRNRGLRVLWDETGAKGKETHLERKRDSDDQSDTEILSEPRLHSELQGSILEVTEISPTPSVRGNDHHHPPRQAKYQPRSKQSSECSTSDYSRNSSDAENGSESTEDAWTDLSGGDSPQRDESHPLFGMQDMYLRIVTNAYDQRQNTGGNSTLSSFPQNQSTNSQNGFTSGTQAPGKGQSNLAKRKRMVTKAKAELSKDMRALFACPFAKKDPTTYRPCYRFILSRVRDVKQHLRRCHLQPIFCPRCGDNFKDADERNEHLRITDCLVRQFVRPEGITEKQERQLSQRGSSRLSEEEQWYSVFTILFPGSPRPISPYVDQSLSEEMMTFRDFLAAEGPTLMSDFLNGNAMLLWNSPPATEDEQAAFQHNTLANGLIQIFDRFMNRTAPNAGNAASEQPQDPFWFLDGTSDATAMTESRLDGASTGFEVFTSESRTTPGSSGVDAPCPDGGLEIDHSYLSTSVGFK